MEVDNSFDVTRLGVLVPYASKSIKKPKARQLALKVNRVKAKARTRE
jgi:hypothetical protein